GDPRATKLLPSACKNANNGSSSAPEIRLPFVDLVMRNELPVFVLREPEQDLLLLLHGPEIFRLHVSAGERRLLPLGKLSGRMGSNAGAALGAEVVAWRQFLLLVIVHEDSLEAYQLPRDLLLSEDPDSHFLYEPVQEFSLSGGFLQLHLLKPTAEQVLLLVASNHTRQQSKCRTFEWLETYFNPLEELTLPALRVLRVVGRQPIYLIFGRSLRGSQAKLVLTVYELDRMSLRLQHRQALTIQAKSLQAVRFRNRNCLIACSSVSADPCLFFRMLDGQFVVYRKHVRRDLHFRRLTATKKGQLLIGARSNGEVLVFSSTRLDCFSGFVVADDPELSEPTGLLSHQNSRNESFLLLAYQRAGSALIRTLQLGAVEDPASNQLGATPDEDLSVVQLHRHEFEESINALRGLLLRRRSALETLSHLVNSFKQKSGIRLEQPLHLLPNGQVERLQLVGHHLRTPTQLKKRLEDLRQRFVAGGGHTKRSARSFGAGNDSNVQEMLKVRRLRVGNLIYQGQLLPGYTLDSKSPPLLTVRHSPVTTKTLQAEELLVPKDWENNTTSADVPVTSDDCAVRHLQVTQINGVSWQDFLDSLFLRSRDSQLQGRLVLQARARVSSLQTRLLNGVVVDKLFNLRAAQVISSNIFMSAFFAPRLEAQKVNGLDFAKDIVFRGDNDTWVTTPVRIDQMSVSGDFQVANPKAQSRQSLPEAAETSLRLQQYYSGKVTIEGSLTVRNVNRDTAKAELKVGNQSLIPSDLQAKYLLKSKPQNISRLTFGYARVVAPSLTTDYLDGHPISDHLLARSQQISESRANRSLHLIFMNASIQGDVLCRDYSTRLAELAKDAVRQGQEANITGYKRFMAPVMVTDLQSLEINGLPVSELVLKGNPQQNFTGSKTFARLVITDELKVYDELNVSRLNGLPLEQLLGHDLSLQRLELMDTPHLQRLYFRRLNGLPFDELLSKISESDGDEILRLHKQLLIEGNVRFEEPVQLQEINGIPWEDYLKRLVRSDANAELTGRKTFRADVQLSDSLKAPRVNDFDLSSLLDNTLLRMTPQEISGSYSFGYLKATNLDVKRVNGVPQEEFLDARKDLRLQGDLYLKKLTINGSLKCPEGTGYDFGDLRQRVEQVQQLPWRNLIVTGDAQWEDAEGVGEQEELEYLRKHAVRSQGNQSISGNVLLRQPYIRVLQSQRPLPQDLNFTYLAADALRRWTATNETQEVTAPVEFLGLVTAGTLRLENDSYFGLVNGIDIKRLNASLYRLSSGEAIAADLRFVTTPKIEKLQLSDPHINGAGIENIFEQGKGQSWPRVTLKNLLVQQNLSVANLNSMSMKFFLDNRIPLKGPALEVFGALSFENLQLGNRPVLRSINGIPLENLVQRHSKQVQTISGTKTFHGGVELTGPGHVMSLNGRDLSESYRESIFRDKDYNIDSLVLDSALFPGGLLLPSNSNPKERVIPTPVEQSSPLAELRDILKTNNQSVSRRLLYLDHDPQAEQLEATWVKSPLRGSAPDLRLLLPESENVSCQRRVLQARLLPSHRRVLLANVSLSSRLLRISSGDVRVKVQNHCPVKRLRSRISFSCRNESHILAMRQPVEMIDLLNLTGVDGHLGLLLLATEQEVRVLRLNRGNCSLGDWQSVTPADGRLMKVVSLKRDEDFLFTSGMQSHRPVLAIHVRYGREQRFQLLQLIQGAYDMAEVLGEEQLLASCLGCRHIAIYQRNPNHRDSHFEPLQQLSFEERIQQVTPFQIGGDRHLLVITQPGAEHFYLFTFDPVAGWQQRTYGFKRQHQWAWSLVKSGQKLEANGEIPVILLCGKSEGCSLVKAILG
ncbi:hypothetical protein KR018_001111, partial [Drosophila ironensis]